uniref:PH domain-containing protein n=1 Tax=Esox lucius TaxID=8010 RepID=A0A6Q2Y7E7_ESOLU
MGNVESQNGDHAFYGAQHGHLARKHTSRSLRISNKHRPSGSGSDRRSRDRYASQGKVEHHNSETSTRSSSTPSIPQSLTDHALEPFNQTHVLSDFSSPIWVDRMAMNLRPLSFNNPLDHPSVGLEPDTASPGAAPHSPQDYHGPQSPGAAPHSPQDYHGPRSPNYTAAVTYLQKTRDGPREHKDGVSFKKKRSKSADMWREDSLEFSLSDLSQEHLTSTEEMIDTEEVDDRDFPDCDGLLGLASPEGLDPTGRTNSLDQLARRPAGRYAKWHREASRVAREGEDDKMLSPSEEDGNSYGAYTLPCRRSHCLSEGLSKQQTETSTIMQGRRAQTIQDVTAGEGSEYEDSGVDVATAERAGHQGRRYKTMSMSFSVCSAAGRSMFAGSDSGSSSGGAPSEGVQGVYENFRQELEMSSCQTESLEEAGSALSDEQSTMSSAYQSDPLLSVAQGTVRKAGRLAVKNFLVHKKSKKVESATRRKWKSYWVCLKGCTLFFYETDGRSGIDHNSVPKHAVWAEHSIVQAVPEHPKKDFVFCLSNSLGDAFLFQTCSQTELENWITAVHSACAAAVARQHHREDTVRLLKAEIKKLEQKIDMDEKMKKMGDMQLSAVTDNKKRKAILDQIFLWEQNLEQFHMGLFRFRCYLASLQGGELPNPKRLLAFASRTTKLAMGRLGIFSVSSFHALVAARTESGVRRRTHAMSRSSSSKRKSSKKDFLKTVHSILRDKQRRQLMKTESLPPNQQYVPFGGKRLCALKGARPAMNRAVSDPARTLGRRKLVRNRFTIDTDIAEVQAGDTDRWVEEQFDLERYEGEQEARPAEGRGDAVKETDILSDDDEFCQSVRRPSPEAPPTTGLEAPVKALSLGEEGPRGSPEHPQPHGATNPGMRLSALGKSCTLAVVSVDDQGAPEGGEDIWVRREDCPVVSDAQTQHS